MTQNLKSIDSTTSKIKKNELELRIEEEQMKGSGWVFDKITLMQLNNV